jgi:plastocyanin
LLIALLGVACVASAASAQRTATTTISITSAGFKPDSVRLQPGDSVTWKNTDTQKHQVVSDTGVFKSTMLDPNESYSYKFDVESSYSYHDGTKAYGKPTFTKDVVTEGGVYEHVPPS